MRLQLSGDQVKSVFTTDSNTLKNLIRENWEQLQRQVEAEGVDLTQPDFTEQSSQHGYDSEDSLEADNAFIDSKKLKSSNLSKNDMHLDHDDGHMTTDEEDSLHVRYA